jgi:small subunit ribosomal protein S17e
MGRIKTALIKRVTFRLFENYKDKATMDFKKNKELVEQFTNVTSKKLRNVIAGYLTRQTKNKDHEKPRAKIKEDLSKFY